ncbi:MAG: Hsp33 family molecular chaperone HslO [Proteobacteria bacterium]|nr:MAG: Hsp33 family molecular chaperone HslO [Pseudomonadota bacterium]
MDKLHRFLIDEANVRGEWVQLDGAWQALTDCADYPAPVRQMLGEAFAAVALLAATIKYNGTLIIQVNGGNPLSMLVVQASSEGKMRGMARWSGDVGVEPTIPALFGKEATLVITVEPRESKGERYQSVVALQGQTLAECLTAYFEQSEQLSTFLKLAVGESSVAGLMVQRLPGTAEDEDGWDRARMLAETAQSEELLTLDVETLLRRLFHEENVRLYEAEPLSFECGCSQEKVDNMLIGLGREEVEATLQKQGKIEITCDFCNADYGVDKIDLERIFSERVLSGNDSVH